ncbi:hypothetical protein Hanom_Chr06g00542081 [Helianthus anomalus]
MLAEIIEEPKQMIEENIEQVEEICFDEIPKNIDVSYSLSDEIYNAFADMYYSSIGISRIKREIAMIDIKEEIINETRVLNEENVLNIEENDLIAQDGEKDESDGERMNSGKFEKEESVKIEKVESEKDDENNETKSCEFCAEKEEFLKQKCTELAEKEEFF